MKIRFFGHGAFGSGVVIWIFGYWLYAAWNPNHRPIFSEQYGYTKYCTFLGFVFKAKKLKKVK